MICRCSRCHAVYGFKCFACGEPLLIHCTEPLEVGCKSPVCAGAAPFTLNYDVVTDGFCAICFPLEQAAIAEARVM